MDDNINALFVGEAEGARSGTVEALKDGDSEGIRLETSSCVKEAISALDGGEFDVVFLDIDSPGISVAEVLRLLDISPANTPVIVISSKDSEVIAREALKNGAHDYLLRDFISPAILRNSIRHSREKSSITNELREAVRIKSKFVSMISHELRTPLTAVKESVRILSDHLGGGLTDQQTDMVALARRNVERLEKIISDMLEFEKIESGDMGLTKSLGDLSSVLSEECEKIASVAAAKGLDFNFSTEGAIPLFEFDSTKMSQATGNILENAVKFTDQGRIDVLLSREGNIVTVSVRDTGPGIDERDYCKVFSQFEQVEDLNERKDGGTGLGLWIAKEIIDGHGGRLWVESDPGVGSTFSFLLPIVERRTR